MAEDYKRAQADAAALQDALAARRASVAIPIVSIKPPMATHTLHSQTQVQARQQAYLPASHPRVTQQAAQNMQQPRLTPTLAQHSMMQRTGPAASSRAYTPILAPATQSSVTHSGQNRIPVPTPASTAAAAAGPAHLSKSQSSSTSTSTAPAIAPYRQPTMQDLPLIKPPPRPRTSSIGTAMTPGGSFGEYQWPDCFGSFHSYPFFFKCPSILSTLSYLCLCPSQLSRQCENGGRQYNASGRVRARAGL